jgi:transketolase
MMEGVSNEACSLAGHLKLGKLIVLYDANGVCLAGSTSLSFTEDVGARLAASGWHVQRVEDGNDIDAIASAIAEAREISDRPSLIVVRTTIGFGAPTKEGTFEAHGSPLGLEELRAAKERLGWPLEPPFYVPPEAAAHFRRALDRGAALEADWNQRFREYERAYPDLARELRRRLEGRLPQGWDRDLPTFPPDPKGIATRKASEKVMQELAARLPELIGGSADLNPSTFTWLKGAGDFQSPLRPAEGAQGLVGGGWSYAGRNLHFGVREHAMGAVVNGLALHGGLVPYGATFLIFSDYMRPALRLSALMRIGTIWVFTHDGIGIGEDGPTHQAVEHYMALRAIPDLLFIRPADANETVYAWKVAIENRHRPTALALTRQNVPVLDRSVLAPASGLLRGGYVLNPRSPGSADPELILIATGSEVALIVAAEKVLTERGVRVRLVSLPCWELFEEQPEDYREAVLPKSVRARLAVETGVTLGWERWIGEAGDTVTLDRFGASAPGPVLMKEFGFTVDNVVAKALRLVGR